MSYSVVVVFSLSLAHCLSGLFLRILLWLSFSLVPSFVCLLIIPRTKAFEFGASTEFNVILLIHNVNVCVCVGVNLCDDFAISSARLQTPTWHVSAAFFPLSFVGRYCYSGVIRRISFRIVFGGPRTQTKVSPRRSNAYVIDGDLCSS